MPVTHVNRKRKTYYLHEDMSKTGKPKFFFSMKSDGRLAVRVPEGFEVYENPNAQVFLRKVVPRLITDDETRTVEEEIGRHTHLTQCRVDIKGNAIIIFEPNQDVDGLTELLSRFGAARPEVVAENVERVLSYSPVLRFILEDETARTFSTERWCFLGSIDDWFPIGDTGKLDTLARRFIKHIGQESFYDLM
jgi:hypothetical protein